jgi:hypothetical protein
MHCLLVVLQSHKSQCNVIAKITDDVQRNWIMFLGMIAVARAIFGHKFAKFTGKVPFQVCKLKFKIRNVIHALH